MEDTAAILQQLLTRKSSRNKVVFPNQSNEELKEKLRKVFIALKEKQEPKKE